MKNLLFITLMTLGSIASVIAQTSIPASSKNDSPALVHKIVATKSAEIKSINKNSSIGEMRLLRGLRVLRTLRFTKAIGFSLKDNDEVDLGGKR